MSNRYFACKSFKEADKALEYIHCIAENYGYATVADVHDILDMPNSYIDTKIGWTRDALGNSKISCLASLSEKDCKYAIVMPEHDWFKKDEPKEDKCCTEEEDDHCEGCDMHDICNSPDEDNENYTSEPFSVAIPLDKYLECPDIVADIAENVTNRPVFITIC